MTLLCYQGLSQQLMSTFICPVHATCGHRCIMMHPRVDEDFKRCAEEKEKKRLSRTAGDYPVILLVPSAGTGVDVCMHARGVLLDQFGVPATGRCLTQRP
jgi:hypothetical protein